MQLEPPIGRPTIEVRLGPTQQKATPMINWNDIKNIDITSLDITKLDLTKLDLTKLDVRNMDLPKVDLPTFDLPKFDLPTLPEIDLPIDVDRVAGFARDAAYAGVGAVVVSVQKVDERRRELTDQVSAQVRKLVDSVA